MRPEFVSIRDVGRGATGIVKEIWPSPNAQRSVAIKIFNSEEAFGSERKRFISEIRYLQYLDHPNIVSILEVGLDDANLWFTMPLALRSLRDEVAEGSLNRERIREVFIPVCLALQYAHNMRVLHRDVKPDNVLVLEDGRGRLCAPRSRI